MGEVDHKLHCTCLEASDVSFFNHQFHALSGFRPALACLERLKDNPPCGKVQLPEEYYHSTEAFLRQ